MPYRLHVVTVGTARRTAVGPGTGFRAALYEESAAELAPQCAVMLLDVPGQLGLGAEHWPRRERLAWYGRWLAETLRAAELVDDFAHDLRAACPPDRRRHRARVENGVNPLRMFDRIRQRPRRTSARTAGRARTGCGASHGAVPRRSSRRATLPG